MVGFNYAPEYWLPCDGRQLPVNQYQALYSVIGNTYGGSGPSFFNLPDLRGRVAVCAGSGPGLTPANLGVSGGQESITLTAGQMPSHTHSAQLQSSSASASITIPVGTDTSQSMDNPTSGHVTYLNAVSPLSSRDSLTFKGLFTNASPSNPASLGLTSSPISLNGNVSVGIAGSSQPFSVVQPGLVVNFIICVNGLYPARPAPAAPP